MISSFKTASYLLLLGVLASCSGDSSETSTDLTSTNSSSQVRVVNVQTETVKTEPFEDYLNLVGSVRASEDISLSAEASGRIIQLLVSRGSKVSKGAPIAKIDDQILILERDRARAQHENAKENYLRRKKIWDNDRIGS
jgi:multidrug efflux pump subunit AcrA (membrane-fusion protein)